MNSASKWRSIARVFAVCFTLATTALPAFAANQAPPPVAGLDIRPSAPVSKGNQAPQATGPPRIVVGQSITFKVTPRCYIGGVPQSDTVTLKISGQPSTGGATATFKPNPVATFSTSDLTLTTTTSTSPGNYTLTVNGTGPKCGVYPPASAPLIVAPKITGATSLWWFSGEKPAGYMTEITLTAEAAGYGPYKWTIIAGTTETQFSNSSSTITTAANTAMVKSIKRSMARNDVSVQVSVKGAVSDPYKLTVLAPYELGPLAITDRADPGFGYESDIHYNVKDQFGTILPSNVPLNEFFTSGVINDFAGTNWRRGPAGGATVAPADWFDMIQGEAVGHGFIPAPMAPGHPLGATAVDHWTGAWRIGSGTPGVGTRVQTNTWQKYRDHARHTVIVSPAP